MWLLLDKQDLDQDRRLAQHILGVHQGVVHKVRWAAHRAWDASARGAARPAWHRAQPGIGVNPVVAVRPYCCPGGPAPQTLPVAPLTPPPRTRA